MSVALLEMGWFNLFLMKARDVYSWRALALIAIFLFLLAQPPITFLTLHVDSEQYTQMSRALLTMDFYRAYDGAEVPLALSLRPPMYPLMLVLADHLVGVSLENGIVLVHLFLALVVLAVAPYALRNVLSPTIAICTCGVALFSTKQLIYCHMSEFLSALFVLGSLLSLIAWFTDPSGKRAVWTCFFVSCAILTRLALLPWLAVVVVFPLFAPRGKRLSIVAGVAMGFLPLLLWASFNLHRLGTFSFGAHGGYMYVAAARTLGKIPHAIDDSAELSDLIDRFNEEGRDVSEEGWKAERVQRWGDEYYHAYHWNFDLAWGPLRSIVVGVPTLPLFLRTARTHSERYIAFLRGGIYTFFHDYALLVVGALLAQFVLLRRAPQYHALAIANVTICIASVLYMVSVLSAFLWVPRYFASVQPALVFSMFSAFVVTLQKFVTRDATFS